MTHEKIQLAEEEVSRLPEIRKQFEAFLRQMGAEERAFYQWPDPDVPYGDTIFQAEKDAQGETCYEHWVLNTSVSSVQVVVQTVLNPAWPHYRVLATQESPVSPPMMENVRELLESAKIEASNVVGAVNESVQKARCVQHIPHRGMSVHEQMRKRGIATLLHDVLDELIGPQRREASALFATQKLLLGRGLLPSKLHFHGLNEPGPSIDLCTPELESLIYWFLTDPELSERIEAEKYLHDFQMPFWIEFERGTVPEGNAYYLRGSVSQLSDIAFALNDSIRKDYPRMGVPSFSGGADKLYGKNVIKYRSRAYTRVLSKYKEKIDKSRARATINWGEELGNRYERFMQQSSLYRWFAFGLDRLLLKYLKYDMNRPIFFPLYPPQEDSEKSPGQKA